MRINILVGLVLLLVVVIAVCSVGFGEVDKTHNVTVVNASDNEIVDTVTVSMLPSCGCDYPYEYFTTTCLNECSYCGGSLLVNPKGVPEGELTCSECGSDWCGVCLKEKYSWSNVYLKEV